MTAKKNRREMEYTPIPGFYDLRDFDIPRREFIKLASIQKYLDKCEQNRRNGLYKNDKTGLESIKELSAKYQQVLFSYNQKQITNDTTIFTILA